MDSWEAVLVSGIFGPFGMGNLVMGLRDPEAVVISMRPLHPGGVRNREGMPSCAPTGSLPSSSGSRLALLDR